MMSPRTSDDSDDARRAHDEERRQWREGADAWRDALICALSAWPQDDLGPYLRAVQGREGAHRPILPPLLLRGDLRARLDAVRREIGRRGA